MGIEKEIQNLSDGLKLLSGDISRIVSDKKGQNKDLRVGKKDGGKISFKSIRPLTRIYKDKDQIKRETEDGDGEKDSSIEHMYSVLDNLFKG